MHLYQFCISRESIFALDAIVSTAIILSSQAKLCSMPVEAIKRC